MHPQCPSLVYFFPCSQQATSWSSSFQPVFLTGCKDTWSLGRDEEEHGRKLRAGAHHLALWSPTAPGHHWKVSSAALYLWSFQLHRLSELQVSELGEARYPLAQGHLTRGSVAPEGLSQKPWPENSWRSSGGKEEVREQIARLQLCSMGRWRSRQRLSPRAQVTPPAGLGWEQCCRQVERGCRATSLQPELQPLCLL